MLRNIPYARNEPGYGLYMGSLVDFGYLPQKNTFRGVFCDYKKVRIVRRGRCVWIRQ